MAKITPPLFPEKNQVSGTVERVTFHSSESGFCVLKVRDESGGNLVTVVGTLAEVSSGQHVTAEGQWVQDQKFGRQLRADHLQTSRPTSIEGMRRYLGSGLVPGIGPAFAERLMTAFGDQVFEVIEKQPQRLLEVPGIGPGRHRRILAAWSDQKVVREIMVFLQGHQVGTGLALRIFKQYGAESIQRVSSDPYCLARDLRGVGFLSADRIAANLGISGPDPSRVAAGVEHVLEELGRQGHTAFPRNDLQSKVQELLAVTAETVSRAVDQLLQEGRLLGVAGSDCVARRDHHLAERELAADLLTLARGEPLEGISAPEKALAWVEKQTGLKLADSQRGAVRQALAHRLLVITGGPGVGKTTLLNSILKIHLAKGRRVVACAPTGRAARKLADSIGLTARTIHRLLEFNPGTGGFRHDRAQPLAGDVFVVDEFSMVDTQLAWKLVRAIPPTAALLLVGDVDQLPSVGPGRVLADVIASGQVPVARLHEVFRQAARSSIVTNAHRINAGQMPLPGQRHGPEQLEDFYFIERDDPAVLADLVVELVAGRLPSRWKVDAIKDIQVLTPMKRGELGTMNLNHRLQEALNPRGPSVQRLGTVWRLGDKVMQTANNYDKDVFNGDSGVIEALDEEAEMLLVRFEGKRVEYGFQELDELMHSYAVSIHKSQGSEFPVVVIPLHTQHYMLLQRNLLYTGVTRGRRLVLLLGSKRAVRTAIKQVDSRKRVTMLEGFLRSGGQG